MSYTRGLIKISKVGISATVIAATKIGTTENGTERFHPMFAVVVVFGANTVVGTYTASIGVTASAYNDIVPAVAGSGLSAVNQMIITQISAAIGNIAANTDIYFNVTVGATATSMAVDVHLFGFYQ